MQALPKLLLAILAASTSCSAQPPDHSPDHRATFAVPAPTSATIRSADQQLTFSLAAPPTDLKGVEVFLDPAPGKPLAATDKSYLATLFFSDEGPANAHAPARVTFTVPLPQPITARARLVLLPLPRNSKSTVTIVAAHIAAPDNSAFH